MNKSTTLLTNYFDKYFIRTIFIIFVLQTLYIVFSIPIGTPADEAYHIVVSILHKDSLNPYLSQTQALETYLTISTSPFLYHYIVGLFSNLNFFNFPLALHMRLLSPVFGMLTLYVLFKTTLLIARDKLKAVFTTSMLSTTMMFVFISGTVSYDNLVNLLAICSIYLFLRLYQKFDVLKLVWLAIVACFAILTKFTLLPLMFILFVLTLYVIFTHRKNLKKELNLFFSKRNIYTKISSIILLILASGLVAGLYGRNIIKHGNYQPSCDAIASHEECYENDISYQVYYDGFIDNEDVDPPVNVLNDFKGWAQFNLQTIYGTLTHRGVFFRAISIVPFALAAIISLLYAAVDIYKKRRIKPEIFIIGLIFCFYAMVLYYHNYNEYLNSGIWNGVQGRYLFPVWPIVYILIANYFPKSKRKIVNTLIVLVFFAVTIITSFGVYYTQKPADYEMDWHQIESYEEFYLTWDKNS